MTAARRPSRGHAWWRAGIEARTSRRLRELQQRGLWDGRPPVPVEHVIEHLLGLSIDYDDIDEQEGEEIVGSFRVEAREIVLNVRHRQTFDAVPGRRRFTLAHEAGHADLYALAERIDQGELGLPLQQAYQPLHRSATRGPVAVLAVAPRVVERLRTLPREMRTEFYRRLADKERERNAAGHDTPLVRRTVDTYAAMLLMPADLVRARAAAYDVTDYGQLRMLARDFLVSTTAMRHRVVDLGLAYESPDGGLQRTDPAHEGQGTLF